MTRPRHYHLAIANWILYLTAHACAGWFFPELLAPMDKTDVTFFGLRILSVPFIFTTAIAFIAARVWTLPYIAGLAEQSRHSFSRVFQLFEAPATAIFALAAADALQKPLIMPDAEGLRLLPMSAYFPASAGAAACSVLVIATTTWHRRLLGLDRFDVTGVFLAFRLEPATKQLARRRYFATVAILIATAFFAYWLNMEGRLLAFQGIPGTSPATPLMLGIAAGVCVSIWQGHLQRMHALFTLTATVAATGLFGRLVAPSAFWPTAVLGLGLGLSFVPAHVGLMASVPQRQRLETTLWTYGLACLPMFFLAWLIPRDHQRLETWIFLGVCPAAFALAAFFFLRELMEQVVEFLIWPIYRVRAYGPGVHQVPLRGPAVVIANHAAWLDPIWLAKALPCRLTPMMTSRFFDLPFIGWIVRVLAHAIRVPDGGFRREAPEIRQAIQRLHDGHIMLVFPEGRMRRSEERVLRRFGQGVYQILRDQPNIPVIACWIDGNWGSYTSFANGPPTKNKKLDFWRRIRIGVSEPEAVPAKILEDSNRTRRYLMQACLNARTHLGLSALEVETFAELDKEEADES